MTTKTESPAKFSVYQEESSKKYYVKYEGKEEREITKMEYNQLKEDKSRIYENSIKEPVMYAQKEKLPTTTICELSQIGKLCASKHESLEDMSRFSHDTCYGVFYETPDSVVIECIFNSEKANGSFRKTLWLFSSFSCKSRKALIMTNLNQQLIDSLKNSDMPLKAKQITKNTIILK